MKRLLCALALLLFTSAISARPLQKLTVMLDWFANPDHAPLFVAQEFGFFKQQGLKVNLIGPADPADPPKLVAAGKIDIAIDYQPQFMVQIDQGLPLVRIGTLIATPLNSLVVLKKGPIKKLSDLKGKTIAYSTAGVDGVMLDALLNKAGLTRKDVHLVNSHYNLTQALMAHRVDAVTGMMRNFELLQMQAAGQPGRAFYPEENGVPPYSELIFVVNRKNVHDPRMKKFMHALNESVQYLINHPKLCWQRFAKAHPELNNPLNKAAWFATLPRFALRPSLLDAERFTHFARFLEKEKLVERMPPLSQYTTVI